MIARSCRDCANFEERRDIDGAVLCAQNIGPFVSCEEFEPRDKTLNVNKCYNRFCIECVNYEETNEISVCKKNHNPGVACDMFKDRFEKLEITRQNNHMKAVLLVQAVSKPSNPEPIPHLLVKIGKKLKW
jgi:hypothetical protein